MAVRNLEQQVEYLTQELTKLKQQLGGALPDPIPGPQGDPGPKGETGPEGPMGYKIAGCTDALPSPTAYRDGDFYLLFNGNLYKKINGEWVLQTSLRGPQGVVGPAGGTEVIANPVGSPTDNLTKINIDGTIYDIVDDNESEITESKVLSKTGRILTYWSDLGDTEDGYINGSGEVVQSDYRKVTGYIKTRPGITVSANDMYLYIGDSSTVYGIACYDKDKNFMLGYGISGNDAELVSGSFTIPEGCYFIRVSDANDSNSTFSIPEIAFTNILVDTINKNVEPFRLNKKIAVFGDSIFAIAGGTGNGIADYMRKYSEAQIDNFALGGTGICDIHNGWSPEFQYYDFPELIDAITSGDFTNQDAHLNDEGVPEYFAEVIAQLKIIDLTEYDIVILSYGANDYTGEMSEATIKSAIDNAITKIYALNSDINIVFDLPHYRLWNDPDDYIDDAYTHENGLDYTLGDIVNFFKEELDTYGIAYIDNLKECNWNHFNMDKYFYHADGAHFLASGCKECAKRIVAKLSSLGFNIEKED